MDKHKTRITLEIVMLARENNIIMLTFPPHCSHTKLVKNTFGVKRMRQYAPDAWQPTSC